MTLLSLAAFAGAMFLLAVTPGPGVFATVARALASGFGHAAVLVLGIVIGDLVFLLLAIYGLAAVAGILGGLFTLVKLAGAAYLIWLGMKLWRSRPVARTADDAIEETSWSANLVSGLVITLGNPKVILFYLGFLPAFVDLQTLQTADVAKIAAVVSLVLGATMLGYAYAAARARRLFQSPKAKRLLNRTSGGVMIATGTVLATRA
jgi:threonine/homoserine/homoserine lactone efflux protein